MKKFDEADLEDLTEAVTELCDMFDIEISEDPIESLFDVVNLLQARCDGELRCKGGFREFYKYTYPAQSVSDFAFAREIWYAAVEHCYKQNRGLK